MEVGLLAAIVALVGSLAAAGVSAYNTNKTNKQNQDINDANLEWSKEQQYETWSREDSSWQRGVADAEAAGLSPLAVTQGNPSGSTVGTPSAIPMQSDNSMLSMLSSSMTSLASNLADNYQKKLDRKEHVTDRDVANTQFYAKLDSDAQTVSEQIESAENMQEKQLLQQNVQFIKDLQQQDLHFQSTLSETKNRRLAEFNDKAFQSYQSSMRDRLHEATGGRDIPTKLYTDKAEYETAKRVWDSKFANFLVSHGVTDTPFSSSTGSSSSSSDTYSANLGLGTNNSSGFGSSNNDRRGGSSTHKNKGFGFNGSVGASMGTSDAESSSESADWTENYKELLYSFLQDNPMPWYHDDYETFKSKYRY